MAKVRETIYDGRDNVVSLVITEDGVPVSDLSGLTRVVLTVGGVAVDSDDAGSDVIWWTDSAVYDGQTVDVLKLRLGHQNIPLGTYTNGCLILFDAVATSGIIYADDMKLTVVEGCSGG